GAGFINDINALQADGAMEAVLQLDVPVCLMHMQGEPGTMQQDPVYENVTGEVKTFLGDRITACIEAGLKQDKLVIDPGFGFGKSVAHNLELLRNLAQFKDFGLPILAGLSRKSLIGKLLARPTKQRLAASLALAVMAVQNGAAILRVHDVAETRDVIRMTAVVAGTEQI
ncbi:MAG: dihydropteroate synthase, partial [Acidiferrobacterales bacterium]